MFNATSKIAAGVSSMTAQQQNEIEMRAASRAAFLLSSPRQGFPFYFVCWEEK